MIVLTNYFIEVYIKFIVPTSTFRDNFEYNTILGVI